MQRVIQFALTFFALAPAPESAPKSKEHEKTADRLNVPVAAAVWIAASIV